MAFICKLCSKTIRKNSNCIFCNTCEHWVHGKCNFLNSNDIIKLKSSETWSCIDCNSVLFPFQGTDERSLNVEEDFYLDVNLKVEAPSTFDEPLGVTNCKYYEYEQLNLELSKLSSNTKPGLSFFHLNSVSLVKHLDEINILLNSINENFSVLGFSETKLNQFSLLPEIDGYTGFHNPAVGNAGGTALYITESLSCFERKDLSNLMFSPKNLESTFIEIPRKSSNIIIGCVYKHPLLSISGFTTFF